MKLELRPVELESKYKEKWNETRSDFLNLYLDDNKVSNTLYRVGGFGAKVKDGYFLLLKYVENLYADNITKVLEDKRHLSGSWCILNEQGEEKVNFEKFRSPYLQGGQIYVLDSNYYNIETGYMYCKSYNSALKSKNYLFVSTDYDDRYKDGVMQINKLNGKYKILE